MMSRAETRQEKSRYDNEDLLARESWDVGMRHEPVGNDSCASPQDVARSLVLSAGRYHTPLSVMERFRLRLFSLTERLDTFSLKNFFSGHIPTGIPYSWQVLFRYLYREKIIRNPVATPCFFLHDQVKMISFQLFSQKEKLNGRGNAGDIETALSKAVGEVLERFFLAEKKVDAVMSAEGLRRSGKSIVSPASFAQFSVEQKNLFPRLFLEGADTGSFEWVKGKALFSGREVFLPTQSVFIGKPRKGECIIREGNSNGGAGGFSLKEALLSGIYEVVERDGFMVHWLNHVAPPVIDATECQERELLDLLERVARYRFEAVFLNTTTDIGIPCVTCVLIDRSEVGPGVAIGSGCGFRRESLLIGSLREALMVYGGGSPTMPLLSLSESYRPFSDEEIDLEERIALWRNPKMFSKIEFFLTGRKQSLAEAFPEQLRFDDISAEYQQVVDIFRRLGVGYEPYYYEAHSRVLDTLGYHVVKVVIPELLPLYLNERYAPLAARRLTTVPENLGWITSLNPWPHPFA